MPSPVETLAHLDKHGLASSVMSQIEARSWEATDDQARLAVRTGVVLADLLLTIRSSDDPLLVQQLQAIRAGLAALGAGNDLDATLADATERVTAGAVNREELLTELEELSQVVIPELEFPRQR